MAKSAKKKLKDKCDVLWAKVVKQRALMRCERCGKMGVLNSHHIWSRKNLSVRHDVSNGVCLCVGCHFWAHQNPMDFAEWIKAVRNEEWYDALRLKAHDTFHGDLEVVWQVLKRMESN